jgi:hypothetical protein
MPNSRSVELSARCLYLAARTKDPVDAGTFMT